MIEEGVKFNVRGDEAGTSALHELGRPAAPTESIELLANEEPSRQCRQAMSAKLIAEGEKFLSELVVRNLMGGFRFLKDVPDEFGKFAGDGDESFVNMHAGGHVVEESLPVRVKPNGGASCGDKGKAQIRATFFGDATGTIFLAGLILAGKQA